MDRAQHVDPAKRDGEDRRTPTAGEQASGFGGPSEAAQIERHVVNVGGAGRAARRRALEDERPRSHRADDVQRAVGPDVHVPTGSRGTWWRLKLAPSSASAEVVRRVTRRVHAS
jgi:hypothetical protein